MLKFKSRKISSCIVYRTYCIMISNAKTAALQHPIVNAKGDGDRDSREYNGEGGADGDIAVVAQTAATEAARWRRRRRRRGGGGCMAARRQEGKQGGKAVRQ